MALVLTCEAQTAGIDFDVSGPITEPGFLSVPATGAKDYNVTHNGGYRISLFTYKVGAGQTTQTFYEGASSAASLFRRRRP